MSAPRSSSFAATRWTLVGQAQGDSAAARAALSELCAAYYAPIVAFLRSRGGNEDAAREQAHAFFARILAGGSLGGADPARGRFRGYLLGAVKHFLADEHDRAGAAKRGGGSEPVPLDPGGSAPGFPTADITEPEHAFDRQWALTVMARALETVAAELREVGKSAHFETLKPWLTGESAALPQATAARQLGMSESAVRVAIHRLRQRFREQVKAEIAQTVPSGADIEDELRHLVAVLVAR
ncbi:MAG: sigma-70 family RNA polymerase sigma factor [Verrucomicrobiota bacterium]|nr:sigma-70 family RNA polymerase sigma factor [Verrucomicrobiota bacterium]